MGTINKGATLQWNNLVFSLIFLNRSDHQKMMKRLNKYAQALTWKVGEILIADEISEKKRRTFCTFVLFFLMKTGTVRENQCFFILGLCNYAVQYLLLFILQLDCQLIIILECLSTLYRVPH